MMFFAIKVTYLDEGQAQQTLTFNVRVHPHHRGKRDEEIDFVRTVIRRIYSGDKLIYSDDLEIISPTRIVKLEMVDAE